MSFIEANVTWMIFLPYAFILALLGFMGLFYSILTFRFKDLEAKDNLEKTFANVVLIVAAIVISFFVIFGF